MELKVCLLVNYPKHYSNSPEDTLALLYAAQEIAELYEQEQNLEQAIAYYDKAADLFQGEEVTTSANQCKQKIA
ncbi:putative NSF attachment protein [Helianthus anomalus]